MRIAAFSWVMSDKRRDVSGRANALAEMGGLAVEPKDEEGPDHDSRCD